MEAQDRFRAGFVALIGRPNTGKSTLMNRLIGQKIAITSSKPQTTRRQIRTIYTDDEAQIVFIDTPGVHIAKNKLGKYMVSVARGALKDVDAVLFMTEPAAQIDEIERELLERIARAQVPTIVVVNKADLFSAKETEASAKTYAEAAPFAHIVRVSALKGAGVDEALRAIKEVLPYGEALYDEDELTDQPAREIVAEIIREKALRLLRDEAPHGIAVQIEKMRDRTTTAGEDICDVEATIICEKETHKGIVIGKGGKMLKKIGTLARGDMEKLLDKKVNLQMFVKVRKNWRNDETQLRSLGYRAHGK